jgi:hypothetical protein
MVLQSLSDPAARSRFAPDMKHNVRWTENQIDAFLTGGDETLAGPRKGRRVAAYQTLIEIANGSQLT